MKPGTRVKWQYNGIWARGTVNENDSLISDDYGAAYSQNSIYIDNITPLKGLEAMKVGDTIADEDGDTIKVLEVGQNSFLYSTYRNVSDAGRWRTFAEVEELGWKLVTDEKPEGMEETIEILGKKLKKSDVEKLIEGLPEVGGGYE